MKSIICSFLVLSMSLPATAAQSLNTKLNNSYSSLRALGMGNAFTAVADDYSLLFYNPAGLARKPYNEVQVSLVGAGVSAKTLTIMDDIKKASDTPGTDNDKAQAISDALQNYYGQSLGGKLQALEMFWVRKGWGIGLVPIDLTIDMSVNRQLGPALDLNIKGDSTIAFGWGQSLNREVDIGLTAKFLHRVAVEQSVSALELATNSNVLSEDRFKEGTNLDFDLGFMWTPGWFAKSASQESAPSVDTTAPAPATPDPEKSEPIKTDEKAEDPKAADPKTDDATKPEEPRKPQAEGDAAPVAADAAKPAEGAPVVADPSKSTDATKKDAVAESAEAGKEDAAKKEVPAQPVVTTPVENSGVVKLGEGKTEEKPSDVNSGDGYPLTLGMTVHNVIAGGFSQSKMVNKNATDVPTKLERTIDVGSQYRFYDGEDLKVRAMLDFHNILHPNVTVSKATHIGLEFDYSPSGWFKTQFRGGLNQMYMTAGATFLFGVLNIDLVTYGEEVGTAANKIENRVMAAKLGFNF